MKVAHIFERDEDTNDVPGRIATNTDGSITARDKLGNVKTFKKGQEVQAQQFANSIGAVAFEESVKTQRPTFIDSLVA